LTLQGKVWGETTEFFRNAMVSAHYLNIKKGGYCSEHKHDHKYNVFFVISGLLKITIWRDENLKDTTILADNQTTAVPPGFWHSFEALKDTKAVEVYQVILEDPDIERRSQGGVKK